MKLSKRVLFHAISDDSVLMINTLTGAMDIITADLYQILLSCKSSGQPHIDEVTLKRLERRGYLITDKAEEARLLQQVTSAYGRATKRLGFVICPTYACNLRCTYCFEGKLPSESHAYMGEKDVDLVIEAIDRLRQTYSDRKTSIELFGGEPLQPKTKGFISKLFKEARHKAIPVGITTNGTHLNRFIDVLDANKDIIRSIQITLDGPKDIHNLRRKSANEGGTFDKICSSISTLLDHGIKVAVRVNVDLQNIDSVPELLNQMVKRGWVGNPYFGCNLSPVRDHTFKKNYPYLLSEDKLVGKVLGMLKSTPGATNVFRLNMFRNLAHIMSVLDGKTPVQPQLYYCEANNMENIVFGPDGYIYVCTESVGTKELAIGEFKPTLKMYDEAVEMWNGRNVLTLDKCKECDIALLCGGGCAYSAIAVNGDINKPVCNRARETILAYLDYVKDELTDMASA